MTFELAGSRGWQPSMEEPMSALSAGAASGLAKITLKAIRLSSTIIIVQVTVSAIRKGSRFLRGFVQAKHYYYRMMMKQNSNPSSSSA